MKVNLTKSPPVLAEYENRAIIRNGDIVMGYKLLLPESYTQGEKDNESFITNIEGALRHIDGEVVVQKTDVYKERVYRFDNEYKKGGGYLREKFVAFHEKRKFFEHECYLFFVWSMSNVFGREYLSNPFSADNGREKKILEELYDTDFYEAVNTAITNVRNTKTIQIEELKAGDISELSRSFFSGFESGSDFDIEKTKEGGLQVGGKEVAMLMLGSLHQLPDTLVSVKENRRFSDKDAIFYEGMNDGFGENLKCDHIVNQVIYFPKHEKTVKEIEKKRRDFAGTKTDSYYNKKAESLDQYLEDLKEKSGIKLVRSHFNVILLAPKKELIQKLRDAKAIFGESDFKPYQPMGKRLWGMYATSFFGFISGMPRRYSYVCKLEEAVAMWMRTGAYRDDKEGIYFFDRDSMRPVKRDLWDAEKVRIKARNFMIIADTGEGKSNLAQHFLYQYLDEGYKLVINDLGKSFQNLSRLYKGRTQFLEFEEGKALGLNPFKIEDEKEVTTEFIKEIEDLIILLAFKEMTVDLNEVTRVSLRKIIKQFYKLGEGKQNLETFQRFLKYLSKQPKMMEAIDVNPDFISLDEYAYSLEEFVGDGIYSFLFKEDSKGAYTVDDADLLVYELDKAMGDPMMLSLLQMFSYQGTKKLIWEDKSKRGYLVFEEFAKQLKFPKVASMCEYLSQAIRKQNGGVGYVLQNVNQLPQDATIDSILGNTQVFHILPGQHAATVERLKLNAHQAYMLNSIKSNFSAAVPYSEMFQMYGKKLANILRVVLPPEHFYAFQTEGELYKIIEEQYGSGKRIETIIDDLANSRN